MLIENHAGRTKIFFMITTQDSLVSKNRDLIFSNLLKIYLYLLPIHGAVLI